MSTAGGDGLGGHRRPAIGVDGELPAVDALPATGLVNEPNRWANAALSPASPASASEL